ncbi:MAG TPA: hypothetical protein VJ792_02680 [Candidatus Nitrosotalea sp.]|nr:hypothetical protein [Candidatus Nitrosotalea sp.]
MYKRLSIFRIALVLIAVGSLWTTAVVASSLKTSDSWTLDRSGSSSLSVFLQGSGIGFYQIASSQYNNEISVKVLDVHGNYIATKTITNKETVNYFTYDRSGQYTLVLTNLSPGPLQVTVGFGDTRYQDLGISSTMLLMGAVLLVLAGYLRLRSYITAHPE